MNYAYITLLSSYDYLDAVLVLNASLKSQDTKYPLVCAVTEDIYDNIFLKLIAQNIYVEKIPNLHYSKEIQDKYKNQSVLKTASKIEIFNLIHYDKLCYIDADSLIMSNIDDIFDYPDGSMVKYDDDDYGFSGLFIFCPKNHQYNFYKHLLINFPVFDGDLIGSLWFVVHTNSSYQIPSNYFQDYYYYTDNNNDIKVWHFCNPYQKPWIVENRKNMVDTSILKLYDYYLFLIKNK